MAEPGPAALAKGKSRGRGYSLVDDREVTIAKALSFVLKRTIQEGEEEGIEERLVADSEGWVDCDDILEHPNISALVVTLTELQSVAAPHSSKSKFTIRLSHSSSPESKDPSDFQIRLTPVAPKDASSETSASSTSPETKLTPLTTDSENLPDLVVYETSYANYPLILASGSIKRAGGQAHLSFSSITVDEEGAEIRTPAPTSSSGDVSIYIDLPALISTKSTITWQLTEAGTVITEGDADGSIPRKFWKKAIARRPDIGVLYEDGEIRKEIPVGLRGKGQRGKRGGAKGKAQRGMKEMKAQSEDEETSSSE
ncbi:putative tRNA 2'-phosphotransferase 1 [Xylogone sp. PMI_703]|nr:putative tRNA 2'-phosphotransferase 1 [Xylogone sp. PMI_703]